ncbi:MAG: hypothetical protein KBT36_14310 [Kurthia sp.]|nr:hypothetical protein [Candidatus Kurthia equi]
MDTKIKHVNYQTFNSVDEITDSTQIYLLVFKNKDGIYMLSDLNKKYPQPLQVDEFIFPNGIEEKIYSSNHFYDIDLTCNCPATINGTIVPNRHAQIAEHAIDYLIKHNK